ncbi:MAG: PQQ-binding-like beta-propeller repeat protein [Thaumarchaeota archaeon]|nr:PQQ-binding-like beta-propeller repeat protein [Nitrososphaerota archaeon]
MLCSPVVAEEAPPMGWYEIWTHEGHDVAYGVATSDDGVYVVTSSGEYLVGVSTFLLKYDLEGNLLWSRNWTRNQINEAHSVVVSSNSVYVVGYTGSTDNFDAFLLKYDLDGNLLWEKVWGEYQYHWAQSLTVSGDRIYVAGSMGGDKGYTAFISTFNLDGALIWNKTYDDGGVNNRTHAYGVSVSGDNIYLAGSTGSEEDYDVFLLKMNSNGSPIWRKIWDNNRSSEARSISISEQDIYVAGWIVEPDNDVEDAILLKYGSDGNLIWSRTYGDIETEIAYGVAVSDDNVYVAGKKGYFQRFGTLLLKYDSNGNIIWNNTYERSRFGGAYGIVVSGASIYTAGVTWGIGAGFYEATVQKFLLGSKSNVNTTTTTSTQASPTTTSVTSTVPAQTAATIQSFTQTSGLSSEVTYAVSAVALVAIVIVAALLIARKKR